MLLQRPGCYFFLGNGDGTHRADGHGDGPCLLHNPSYDFNDDAIPVGATLWVRLVEASCAANPPTPGRSIMAGPQSALSQPSVSPQLALKSAFNPAFNPDLQEKACPPQE